MSGGLAPEADRDSAPFWEALGRHRLEVQRCDRCGIYRFPPGPVCPRCGDRASTWTPLSGRGRVLTWVVTHQVFHPAFADRVPYTVVLVRLDEQDDLLIYGNVRPEGSVLREGLPVAAVFEEGPDGSTLLQWQPTSDRPGG
jgi:uncharacterized protein